MIPLSQIEIKHTDGKELEYIHSGEDFVGFYIETNDGEFFSGTNNIILGKPLRPVIEDMNKNPQPTKRVLKYNLFKRKIKAFLSNTLPMPVMKQFPRESDYSQGYMIRYFAKRINHTTYFEIEKTTYDRIKNQDGTYDHYLYEVGSMKWYLIGNVYKGNAIELKTAELKFKNISYLYPLLNEFFRPTMETQENLHTDGGELYYADGIEYIGLYHIHPTEGPMVGAYHTDVSHPRLYYTNQLPMPDDMLYEDWLKSFQNEGNIPLKPPDRGQGGAADNITFDGSENEIGPNTSYNCHAMWTAPPLGYQGITNGQGLVPRGTACIDPEDGSGTYSYTEYGENVLNACEVRCSELQIFLDPLNGDSNTMTTLEATGCKLHWDPNYCADCGQHSFEMCMGNYFNNVTPGTCFCGNYGGYKWYHASCCSNFGRNWDDTTVITSGGGGGNPYGWSGGTCFTHNTIITMADGTEKTISTVKIGDKVKSEIGESTVLDIQIHKGNFEVYSFNNGNAFVTEEHPFKTTEGWKSINPMTTLEKHKVESETLNIGDVIYKINKNETIKKIEKGETTHETVYNLMLDNEHVYYANGYLVHNEKGVGISRPGQFDESPEDYEYDPTDSS
jgi:hypothetical protein